MAEVVQAVSKEQIAAVQELLREYLAWSWTLDPNNDKAPTFAGVDEEVENLPGVFAPPRGQLLLATHEGKAAGCVAMKPHDQRVCELKRLYVRPGFRGHAIGWKLVSKLVATARDLGYARMVLDSHVSMSAAHHLYQQAGFVFVPTPADFPEELKSRAVFMECDLAHATV